MPQNKKASWQQAILAAAPSTGALAKAWWASIPPPARVRLLKAFQDRESAYAHACANGAEVAAIIEGAR